MPRDARNLLFVLPALFVLGACQWVKPKPGAEAVALVKHSAVQSCEKLGVTTVAVKDDIGPIKRKQSKVVDELLTLARNEAAAQSADTIVAESAIEEGRQRFALYRCVASRY